MQASGLTERRALRIIGMSASALRYEPAPDRNASLRDSIQALAHRHRRYGAEMIYLKLRQQGWKVNHKRVERLYAEARLQVRRRKRKKFRWRIVSLWKDLLPPIRSGPWILSLTASPKDECSNA